MSTFYGADEFELIEEPNIHNFNRYVNEKLNGGWTFWERPEIKSTEAVWRYVATMVKRGRRIDR